jgi:MFS family permease
MFHHRFTSRWRSVAQEEHVSQASAHPPKERLGSDFLRFWIGQTVSNLGSSVTFLAIPLLIYERTESALYLSLASISNLLPYLLFGLLIGAWVDRVDRKRLMIWTDIARTAVILTIPVLSWLDALPLAWIFVAAFANSTLSIAFNSAEFAAIPSLVSKTQLVSANGRIQASYAGATVIGPLVAGLLAGVYAIETILVIDACSYLVSAVSLALVRAPFNPERAAQLTSTIRADMAEGLRYVFSHPVLRAISLMMAIINFLAVSTMDQLVLFSKERLGTGESGVGLLFSAGGLGVILLSLLAGRIREHAPFSKTVLSALIASGMLTIAFALTTWFPLALLLFGLTMGCNILFNINTGSLRQLIVPGHMLGRVMSVASVMAMSLSPLGSFIGGLAVEWTGAVALVYGAIGMMIILVAAGFSFTALGQAERYLPGGDLERPATDAIEPEPQPVAA